MTPVFHQKIFFVGLWPATNKKKRPFQQNRDPNRDPKPQKVSIRDPGLLIETQVAALRCMRWRPSCALIGRHRSCCQGRRNLSAFNLYKTVAREAPGRHVSLYLLLKIIVTLVQPNGIQSIKLRAKYHIFFQSRWDTIPQNKWTLRNSSDPELPIRDQACLDMSAWRGRRQHNF